MKSRLGLYRFAPHRSTPPRHIVTPFYTLLALHEVLLWPTFLTVSDRQSDEFQEMRRSFSRRRLHNKKMMFRRSLDHDYFKNISVLLRRFQVFFRNSRYRVFAFTDGMRELRVTHDIASA